MALRNEYTSSQPKLFLQGIFSNQHKSYAVFERELKEFKNADYQDLQSGKYDGLIQKHLDLCKKNEDRFILHQLAYVLFSDIRLDLTNNIYQKILAPLLYDKESEIHFVKKVIKDAYYFWKKNPYRYFTKSLDGDYFMKTLKWVYEDLTNSTVSLTRPILREIFSIYDNKKGFRKNVFITLEKTLLRYLSADAKEVKHILSLRKKIENLIESAESDEVELISAKELIESWVLFEDLLLGKVENFGEIPLYTFSWESKHKDSIEPRWSHGGGLFFFSSFLLGENKGYPVAEEEGGLGMYFDPSNGEYNYGDEYYAQRFSMHYFDIPISVKCNFAPNATEATIRHTNEAILRHTHREEITLKSLDLLPVESIPGISLRPRDLDVYVEDLPLCMQICESAIRLKNIFSDEWKVFLEDLKNNQRTNKITMMK